jgi:hypothetical protein
MGMSTIYVQVVPEGQPIRRDESAWRPWINCKDRSETVGLAAHRHVRESGIMNRGTGIGRARLHVLTSPTLPAVSGPVEVHQSVIDIIRE